MACRALFFFLLSCGAVIGLTGREIRTEYTAPGGTRSAAQVNLAVGFEF